MPDFGIKRDMTAVQFLTRWRTWRGPIEASAWNQHHAIVLGTGLAGCTVAEQLASRDWRIMLIDENEGPARDTPTRRVVVMYSHVPIDDSALSQLSHVGNLFARRHWGVLDRAGFTADFQCTGVL